MAIIILCFRSPPPKHRHDLHCHRLDTLISIVASWSSRQLLLLQLSLTHTDKVKKLHGDRNSYNKMTTIWLLPVADKLQNMIISYNNVYHIMSYHITSQYTLQKQVRCPLLCCCKFYVAATGLEEPILTYAKPQCGSDCFLIF